MIDDSDLIEIEFDLSQSNKRLTDQIDHKVRLLCANNTKLLALTRSNNQSTDTVRCFTGLAVYGGAQVLSSLVCQIPELFNRPLVQTGEQSMNLLELGCGIGLAGITIVNRALKQNSAYLLMTDGESEAVKLARRNIERSISESAASQVDVIEASWSSEGQQTMVNQLLAQHRTGRFHVIYGTDLLYAKTLLRSILNVSIPLLSEYGMLMLVHTPRTVGIHEELQRLNGGQFTFDDQSMMDLKMFYVRCDSFLTEETMQRYQWYGVDVCCIVRAKEYPTIKESLERLGLVLQAKSHIEQAMDDMDQEDQMMGLQWSDED